ncbi:uncharacterized protein AKAME5_000202000 [Lates japonicus]|uniref:Uncharacterized protein n=1 Tax=Lates japonicus TaxID=270547 RepID=A0AAD3M5F6_LATJO|nr:uncharacterized protein AKAME5_000202000 [Lates japonicus]
MQPVTANVVEDVRKGKQALVRREDEAKPAEPAASAETNERALHWKTLALVSQRRRRGGGEGGDLGGVVRLCAGGIEFGLRRQLDISEALLHFVLTAGVLTSNGTPGRTGLIYGTRSAAARNFNSPAHLDSWRPSRRQIIDQSAVIRLWPPEHWGMEHAEQEEPQCDPTLCPSVTPCCPTPSLAWAPLPLKPSVPEATSLDLYRAPAFSLETR